MPNYPGSELSLFAQATTWKRYFKRQVDAYLVGVVVEVGAGLGHTTRILCDGRQRRWICVEPDPQLFKELVRSVGTLQVPTAVEAREGSLRDLVDVSADAIVYCDVLEHIEDDRAELAMAATRLRPGGHLVVLGPAYPWLYSDFDRGIGHWRRYTAATLARLTPASLRAERFWYLDSVGVMASLANRALLRQPLPSPSQLRVWDRVLMPLSRVVDPVVRYRFGRSVIGVWRKPP